MLILNWKGSLYGKHWASTSVPRSNLLFQALQNRRLIYVQLLYFYRILAMEKVHASVLIKEIDHLVLLTMSSFLFYDRFLCWEHLVYQGHMSSKEHKFGTFESLVVIASFL